jgi:hypothetical protein
MDALLVVVVGVVVVVVMFVRVGVVVVVVVVGLIISRPTLLSLFSSVDSSEATFHLPVTASSALAVIAYTGDQFVARRLLL